MWCGVGNGVAGEEDVVRGDAGRGSLRGTHGVGVWLHRVLERRRVPGEIAGEEVPAATHHVLAAFAVAVVSVGKEDEIEVFVGFDEGVDEQKGVVEGDVVVHGAVGEEQVALEVFGVELVGLSGVVGGAVGVFVLEATPFFGPVVLVHALVVIAGLGDANLEEIRIAEHGGSGGVAAAGVAPDADAVEVDEGVFRGEFADAGDLVGEGVVGGVDGVDAFMEALGAEVGAHAVEAKDDEAEIGEGLVVAVGGGEVAAAAGADLRAGIDIVDDWVFLCWVEGGGFPHVTEQVRLAVAGFDGDRRKGLPAGGEEGGDVLLGDGHEELAGAGVAKGGDLRRSGAAGDIDEDGAVV